MQGSLLMSLIIWCRLQEPQQLKMPRVRTLQRRVLVYYQQIVRESELHARTTFRDVCTLQ